MIDNGDQTTKVGYLLMKITQDEVLHVAKLAHLNLDEKAVDKFSDQIRTILEYVDTLDHVDTKDVVPTSHANFMINAFRDDIEQEHFDRKATLANAPEKEDGSFLVPEVIV
jgi:aspartyl-tRNA(Asn)/glutamyl-tRNA(Gln) amidotransferase subunit C